MKRIKKIPGIKTVLINGHPAALKDFQLRDLIKQAEKGSKK